MTERDLNNLTDGREGLSWGHLVCVRMREGQREQNLNGRTGIDESSQIKDLPGAGSDSTFQTIGKASLGQEKGWAILSHKRWTLHGHQKGGLSEKGLCVFEGALRVNHLFCLC